MRRAGVIAAALAVALLGAGCGGADDGTLGDGDVAGTTAELGQAVQGAVEFGLDEVDRSGVTGRVALSPDGLDRVDVHVLLDRAEQADSVRLHQGTCGDLGRMVATVGRADGPRVEGGAGRSLAELVAGDYAVVAVEGGEVVACGDVPAVPDVGFGG